MADGADNTTLWCRNRECVCERGGRVFLPIAGQARRGDPNIEDAGIQGLQMCYEDAGIQGLQLCYKQLCVINNT